MKGKRCCLTVKYIRNKNPIENKMIAFRLKSETIKQGFKQNYTFFKKIGPVACNQNLMSILEHLMKDYKNYRIKQELEKILEIF